MNAARTSVACVIPVHNRRQTTLRFLRSLARVDASGLELKVFVVDDGSTDGTSEAVAAQFPEVTILKGNGSLHYAAGTNRGISAALETGCDFILTMNDDTVLHDQFLQRMVAAAGTHPRAIIGALLLLWDEPHRVFQVGQRWRTMGGGWEAPEDLTAFSVPAAAFEVECIVGNCVLFPTDAIRECGLMDEKHFPYGWGDAQYVIRMRKAGWNLYVEPRALVWCEPNTYPPPLHTLPVSQVIRNLIIDERHPQNLKRQFIARWYSAPDAVRACAAFAVYCALLAGKALVYGSRRETGD